MTIDSNWEKTDSPAHTHRTKQIACASLLALFHPWWRPAASNQCLYATISNINTVGVRFLFLYLELKNPSPWPICARSHAAVTGAETFGVKQEGKGKRREKWNNRGNHLVLWFKYIYINVSAKGKSRTRFQFFLLYSSGFPTFFGLWPQFDLINLWWPRRLFSPTSSQHGYFYMLFYLNLTSFHFQNWKSFNIVRGVF